MIGQIIADRYQILKVLGSGNVAKTYLVRDLHHPDRVRCVVKHLVQNPSDPELSIVNRQLFTREIESLEALSDYTQVPRLIDYFEQGEDFYLVQEFIDGHSLAEELPMGAWWKVSRVLQFLEDMLTLLSSVHGKGIVHRDIKPANIMCCHQRHHLVLVDFGAAYFFSPSRPEDNPNFLDIVVGTPGYMAAEQAVGNPQFNSDLYSLGMIAIQALTGTNPRQLREYSEGERIWQQQVKAEAAVVDVLSRLVNPQYTQRFQSAAEALAAIQAMKSVVSDDTVDDSDAVTAGPSQFRCYAHIDCVPLPDTELTEVMPPGDISSRADVIRFPDSPSSTIGCKPAIKPISAALVTMAFNSTLGRGWSKHQNLLICPRV